MAYRNKGDTKVDSQTDEGDPDIVAQRRRLRQRLFHEPVHRGNGDCPLPEGHGSLDALQSRTIPGFTIAQVIQIRKIIREQQKSTHESGWQGFTMTALLVILISIVAGIGWQKIKAVESDLLNKSVDIAFNVALTIIEHNPELLSGDKVVTLLKLAEREVQSRLNNEKNTFMRGLGDLLSTASAVTSESLLRMADTARQQPGEYLRTMTLYKLSYQLFKLEQHTPDDKAKRIGLTVAQVATTVRPLVHAGGASRDLAVACGLRYTEQLLNDLLLLENVSSSVMALSIGRCSVDISYTLSEIGEYQKAVEMTQNGLTVMKKEFNDDVAKYQYYGYLFNNQGMAYELLKDYVMAENSYAKALEAKVQAVDYQSETVKQADIKMTTDSLQRAQANLK